MSNIGLVELLIIIAVLAVLILVPKRLPPLFRMLRRSVRRLWKGRKRGRDDTGLEADTDERDE